MRRGRGCSWAPLSMEKKKPSPKFSIKAQVSCLCALLGQSHQLAGSCKGSMKNCKWKADLGGGFRIPLLLIYNSMGFSLAPQLFFKCSSLWVKVLLTPKKNQNKTQHTHTHTKTFFSFYTKLRRDTRGKPVWFLQKWTNHKRAEAVMSYQLHQVPILLVVYRPAVTLQTFHHTSGALFLSSYNYFGLEFHFFLLCGQPCLWAVLFWREDTWVCCRKAPKQWQHRRNLSFSASSQAGVESLLVFSLSSEQWATSQGRSALDHLWQQNMGTVQGVIYYSLII